ncbi:hypothetical protein Tco_1337636 [Tanacetum coccineum]
MGDEVISTILERENDEFIKSSVNDLVLISRKSELTFDSTDLECSMPINPPLPCIDVLGDAIVDIDLLLGEHLDTLSTGDREIDFNPRDLMMYFLNTLSLTLMKIIPYVMIIHLFDEEFFEDISIWTPLSRLQL